MCSKMKVEVIHKETVTPSSPTPHHLRIHNLSIFDQLMHGMYIPLLFFYPNQSTTIDCKINTIDHHHSLITERSKLLKTALSKTLSRFYPFAGTIVSDHNNVFSICCNDHGAAFIETRVNCPISKVMENQNAETLDQLFPSRADSTFESLGYLLLVQANFFECGGLAIGVSVSHKIADLFTAATFIRSWAAMGLRSDVTALPVPEFGAATSFVPPQELTKRLETHFRRVNYEACVTRRLVFDASKIACLKSKATSASNPNPTRVEVVTTLIWKCAMEASRSNLGFTKPSMLFLTINLRKVMGRPSLMGNLVGASFTANTQESDATLQNLVAPLRRAIEEVRVKFGNGVSGDEVCQHVKQIGYLLGKNDVDNYRVTSGCRFGFYETNFGWGKPSWFIFFPTGMKNWILLFDTKDDDGIEAYVCLKEDEMTMFETIRSCWNMLLSILLLSNI